MQHDTVWEFETEQFRIALEITPEDMSPADCFEFEEDIEAVLNGSVEWFIASVVVYKNGYEIGRDSLGACAYSTIEEFYTSHRDTDPMNRNCSIMRAKHGKNVSICHYFPSMVAEAIADARKTLKTS